MTNSPVSYHCLRGLLLLPLALAACTFPKILGDSPLDGNTSSGSASTGDSTSTGPDATTQPTGDGPPPVCDNPLFTCTNPLDCEQWKCGTPASPFDANGCLRRTCDNDDQCGEGELCFDADPMAGCSAALVGCSDDGDDCNCQYGDDCATIRHCIPADQGPPAECSQHDNDLAGCEAAGCHLYIGGIARYAFENGACVPEIISDACLWFPNNLGDGGPGSGTAYAYYEIATGLAANFGNAWTDPPWGWADCQALDAPPSCQCVSPCADLQHQAELFLDADKPCNDVSDCAFADGICYDQDTCGNVGVHKDNLDAWNALHAELGASGCCDGANACGANLACENQRCVATFP